jgi:hypothetical protein
MLNGLPRSILSLLAAGAMLVLCHAADARTLLVGPDRALVAPGAAAAIASDGDTIRIDPGAYVDCAVWRASGLTIVATAPGVVVRDHVCQGKAIFVTVGHDITLRGITFQHARAWAHNGAGIRAEGANLAIIDCTFVDNENGILAAPMPTSTIRVRDSTFRGNGSCVGSCAHGIYVNEVATLEIIHSRFVGQYIGHNVKSRAARTVLIDNVIEDGPDGTSSYLVDLPFGGDLVMHGNALQKGPKSDNPQVALTLGEEGARNPTRTIDIRDNQFRNDGAQPTVFVRNMTATPAELRHNSLSGPVVVLEGPGVVHP